MAVHALFNELDLYNELHNSVRRRPSPWCLAKLLQDARCRLHCIYRQLLREVPIHDYVRTTTA